MTHQELATSSKAFGSKDYFRVADNPEVDSVDIGLNFVRSSRRDPCAHPREFGMNFFLTP